MESSPDTGVDTPPQLPSRADRPPPDPLPQPVSTNEPSSQAIPTPANTGVSLSHITACLDTLTDLQMSNLITNLPESWEAINPIGERINKRMLLHACWGHCKDDEAARILTQDILTAYPCEPTAPPIYGTLATAHMQTSQSTNSLRHPISAPHTVSDPLSAGLAIFQIYKPSGRNSGHFFTVTVSRHQLYLYDSLPHSVARDTTNLLVTTIKRFYANQSPDLASQLANRVTSMHTPRQVDQPTPWSCSMHMLCSSLAAVYQQTNPCLLYDQSHVDQMHRIHLRRLITGTLHPWLADFIPLLQNLIPPDQMSHIVEETKQLSKMLHSLANTRKKGSGD